MTAFKGRLKDSAGNVLHPETTAENVSVGDCTLAEYLRDKTPVQTEVTLSQPLSPGDLYQVPEYSTGKNNILMWLDGLLVIPSSSACFQEHASETGRSTFVIVNDSIPAGSVVTVRVA